MAKHKVRLVRKGMDSASTVQVFLDGEEIQPDKSQKVWNHSPDGFNAGYLGSGPAQTALGILLEVTNQRTAVKWHQPFKDYYLSDPTYQEQGTFEFRFDLDEFMGDVI